MRRLLILGALLLAACDAPTIPARTQVYAFALANPPLVFHWPAGSSIQLYVSGGGDAARANQLVAATEHALAAWNDAVLYGEYRLTRTGNIAQADVLVRWSDVPLEVASPDAVRCGFQTGRAVTTFCPSFDAQTGEPSGRLQIFPQATTTGRVRFVVTLSTVEAAGTRLAALVTHEIGHTLGLLAHPPISVGSSVMLESPTDSVPTAADRATIQTLYHTRPDVVP